MSVPVVSGSMELLVSQFSIDDPHCSFSSMELLVSQIFPLMNWFSSFSIDDPHCSCSSHSSINDLHCGFCSHCFINDSHCAFSGHDGHCEFRLQSSMVCIADSGYIALSMIRIAPSVNTRRAACLPNYFVCYTRS